MIPSKGSRIGRGSCLHPNGKALDSILYDGTYPGSTKVGDCAPWTGDGSNFSNQYKTFLRKFWEAQATAFEKGQGWIYWTWKTESAAEWSYSAGMNDDQLQGYSFGGPVLPQPFVFLCIFIIITTSVRRTDIVFILLEEPGCMAWAWPDRTTPTRERVSGPIVKLVTDVETCFEDEPPPPGHASCVLVPATTTAMKPASNAVIGNAIDLILKDTGVHLPGNCAVDLSLHSPSDRKIWLKEMDLQIEVVSETLRHVQSHFYSRISQMKAQRNKHCVIHRLPVEVLTEIFRLVVGNSFFICEHYKGLHGLSGVCKLWAAALVQAPMFWTNISANNHPSFVSKLISRSGNCPLFINKGIFLEGAPRSTRSFLQQLLPQIHRWKTASLSLRNIQHLPERLINASVPQLEELSLSAHRRDGGGQIDLFRGGAERLKKLDLWGVSIPWTSPLLLRLQVLRLMDLGDSAGVTTTHILNVLAQCTELSALRISGCSIHYSEAPNLPARLELPHLRSLSIDRIAPPNAPFWILSRISTPKYDQFDLVCSFAGHLLPDDPLQKISHITPSLVHLVASAQRVAIALEGTGCQYTALPGGWDSRKLRLSITHLSTSIVLGWVVAAFCDAMKNIRSEVAFSRFDSLLQSDLATIDRTSLVTKLSLAGEQTFVIRHLSTTTLVDGKQRWLFPELVTLSIDEDSNHPDEILRMVERRYGRTTEPNDAEADIQLPTPLTSLVIYGSGKVLDGHTFHRLREIVGEDCFKWDTEYTAEDDEGDSDDEEDEDDEDGGDNNSIISSSSDISFPDIDDE
ncbi:exo-1,3-beta-glucanase [Tulasnella sp. 403]|nr:exo-1,3-beta-glucanase [Tulasnella sp. 403]